MLASFDELLSWLNAFIYLFIYLDNILSVWKFVNHFLLQYFTISIN